MGKASTKWRSQGFNQLALERIFRTELFRNFLQHKAKRGFSNKVCKFFVCMPEQNSVFEC